jgi:RimJ/RimL family protein N-acetyltransferase
VTVKANAWSQRESAPSGGATPADRSSHYIVFGATASGPGPSLTPRPEVSVCFWRPTWRRLVPTDAPLYPFLIWWFFRWLGVFKNSGFRVLILSLHGRPVHRSCVFPSFFRFPFMARHDLQIGDTWTEPNHRGKGLATYAIQLVLAYPEFQGRRIWYVVHSSNAASICAAERAGFKKLGAATRTKRFGLSAFGQFCLKT